MTFQLKIVDTTRNSIDIKIKEKGKYLTWKKLFEYWGNNSNFREYFTLLLLCSPFPEYYLRFSEVSNKLLNKPFSFKLQRTYFKNPENAGPFKKYINECKTNKKLTNTFLSIDKTTWLIIPCKISNKTDHTHLSVFLKTAPFKHIEELWKAWSKQIRKLLKNSNKSYWLNTHGKGVFWLHLRIDPTPKYYDKWF